MNHNYDKNGEVNTNRGRLHEYLRTTSDFLEKEKVKINMDKYVESMLNESPMKISKSDLALSTVGNNIFEKGNRKSLGEK